MSDSCLSPIAPRNSSMSIQAILASAILLCSQRPFGQQLLDGLCSDGSWAALERAYIIAGAFSRVVSPKVVGNTGHQKPHLHKQRPSNYVLTVRRWFTFLRLNNQFPFIFDSELKVSDFMYSLMQDNPPIQPTAGFLDRCWEDHILKMLCTVQPSCASDT